MKTREETVRLGVRVPAVIGAALLERAAESGVSASELVRRYVEDGLAQRLGRPAPQSPAYASVPLPSGVWEVAEEGVAPQDRTR